MANIPAELKYTKEHEWVKLDGNTAVVGITDYAQGELGDIVFVELPSVGDTITQNEPFGTLESVKAVSDLIAPINGTIESVNEELESKPELLNEDPYGEGWIIKIKISDQIELENLLSSEDYASLVQ